MTFVCRTSPLRFDGSTLKLAEFEIGVVGAAFNEARGKVLIAAAYGSELAQAAWPYLAAALKRHHEGAAPLALMHLALAGLPPLQAAPGAEMRLAQAAALMKSGVSTQTILDALDGVQETRKFRPDQPRVPAGNGRRSGEWTGSNSTPVSFSTKNPSPSGNPNIADVADNTTYHNWLRDEFAALLKKAGNTVLTEVPFILPTTTPVEARMDIIFRTIDGKVVALEVKTGDDPTFTPNQLIVYPHLETDGVLITNDPRVLQLGLPLATPLPQIETLILRNLGPNQPINLVPLERYMRQ